MFEPIISGTMGMLDFAGTLCTQLTVKVDKRVRSSRGCPCPVITGRHCRGSNWAPLFLLQGAAWCTWWVAAQRSWAPCYWAPAWGASLRRAGSPVWVLLVACCFTADVLHCRKLVVCSGSFPNFTSAPPHPLLQDGHLIQFSHTSPAQCAFGVFILWLGW